jgi:hypothetical protein
MNSDLACEENFAFGDPDKGNSEFASIDDKWRKMERVQLEAASDGLVLVDLGGGKHAAGANRDYEQEQERSRRKFETDRDLDREKLEREMSDLADTREAARQTFEEKLAQVRWTTQRVSRRNSSILPKLRRGPQKWQRWRLGSLLSELLVRSSSQC